MEVMAAESRLKSRAGKSYARKEKECRKRDHLIRQNRREGFATVAPLFAENERNRRKVKLLQKVRDWGDGG